MEAYTISPLAQAVEELVCSEELLKRKNTKLDKHVHELQREVAVLQRALEMVCADYSKYSGRDAEHLRIFYKYSAEGELS